MGDGGAAGTDHRVVGGLVGPGEVATLGVAGHMLAPDPGGECAGGSVGGLLARHHKEAGARVGSPQRRHDQRAGGLGHRERSVVAGAQLVEEGHQFGCGEQLPRDSVY